MSKNPYDSIEEAHRRLLGTVVMYDGDPYNAFAITNHKPDGIFRVYLLPVQSKGKGASFPGGVGNYIPGGHDQGAYLDTWLANNPESGVLRKHANSPAFNRFRPFPLGMMNDNGRATYLERSPERRTQQGLLRNMVDETKLSLDGPITRRFDGALTGSAFYDCVKGNHPSAKECLENLLDPNVENTSVAFNRHMAFLRGPMDLLFLSYKGDVVGIVPADKRPQVELTKKYGYLKETVQETNEFAEVRVRDR